MARADPCTRAEGHPEHGAGMGKGMWGNFSRTWGEVKIGDNVVAMLRTRAGSCKRQDGGETTDQTF